MRNSKSEIRSPMETPSPKSETGWRSALSVLDCGGKRSATPLWPDPRAGGRPTESAVAAGALPAHSKTWPSLSRWSVVRGPWSLAFCLLIFIILHSAFCIRAWGQYSLDWSTTDGGGGTSTGGVYAVSGTIASRTPTTKP